MRLSTAGLLPILLRVRLPLEVSYIGDAARFYVGDKLVFDNFYNGNPVTFPLWRIPRADWAKLRLKILPYSVFYNMSQKK